MARERLPGVVARRPRGVTRALRAGQIDLFIAYAQRHIPAVMVLDFDEVKLRCSVTASGWFIKKCVALAPQRAAELGETFLEASMSTRFDMHQFRAVWLTHWDSDLGRFQGTLKREILEWKHWLRSRP